VMVATTEIEPPPTLIAGANDGQIRGVARLGDRLVAGAVQDVGCGLRSAAQS